MRVVPQRARWTPSCAPAASNSPQRAKKLCRVTTAATGRGKGGLVLPIRMQRSDSYRGIRHKVTDVTRADQRSGHNCLQWAWRQSWYRTESKQGRILYRNSSLNHSATPIELVTVIMALHLLQMIVLRRSTDIIICKKEMWPKTWKCWVGRQLAHRRRRRRRSTPAGAVAMAALTPLARGVAQRARLVAPQSIAARYVARLDGRARAQRGRTVGLRVCGLRRSRSAVAGQPRAPPGQLARVPNYRRRSFGFSGVLWNVLAGEWRVAALVEPAWRVPA